ncbi:MAG: hypothetical protein J6L59_00290 [Clostridia bacterium]|nr:hypothetical protein [Clostridia bacterium]
MNRPYNTDSSITAKITGKAFMPSAIDNNTGGMDKSIPYNITEKSAAAT